MIFSSSDINTPSLELVLERPGHKALDRRACALVFVEHGVDLFGYRQLDAATPREQREGARGFDPLGNLTHARQHFFERAPAPEFMPDATVARERARARKHKV